MKKRLEPYKDKLHPKIDNTFAKLAPGFLAKLELLLNYMVANGQDPYVFETFRTDARQRYLYGYGRLYDDGRGIVTYSSSSFTTWHGYGLAADIISVSSKWNASLAFWSTLHKGCRRFGLTWGADWNNNGDSSDEKFKDFPHVQWGKCRRSPSIHAKELYDQGGLEAVWREVKAL